jgi:hypothetical protein
MTALRESHVDEMIAIVESTLHKSANLPIDVALHERVKACIAAHAINPTHCRWISLLCIHHQLPKKWV